MSKRRKSKSIPAKETAQEKKAKALDTLNRMPRVDVLARYSIIEASLLLRQCEALTYRQMAQGQIKTLKLGGRTYVPGSEIARLSTLPAEAPAMGA